MSRKVLLKDAEHHSAMRRPTPGHLFLRTQPTLALLGRPLLLGTLATALILLIGLGLTGRELREEARATTQNAVRVAELRGAIVYLDDETTKSAQAATMSGEHRWLDRDDDAVPKLDAAIAEATALASPEARAAFASSTVEAHGDLATVERRTVPQKEELGLIDDLTRRLLRRACREAIG